MMTRKNAFFIFQEDENKRYPNHEKGTPIKTD
jgi:hypothetical protein